MKVIVKGFITVEKKSWDTKNPYRFDFFHESSKDFVTKDLGKSYVADYEIEIEAPDNLDEVINNQRLTFLQEKRKLILAENQQRINDIDRQIGELLAIENKDDAA